MTIQEIIDAKFRKEQEERKLRERSGKFNPSKFGRCYRAQIWNRRNEPESDSPDERTLRVFGCGKIFHDWVQKILLMETEKENPDIEVRVETDDVLGFADIVFADEVIDLKSQHSRAFHYHHQEGFDLRVDKKPDFLQAAFYAIQLNKPFFRLVYISKDDLCIAEYKPSVTTTVKAEVGEELKTLRDYWSNNILPAAEPRAYIEKKTGKSKECGYCGFYSRCQQQGPAAITL